MLVYLDWSKLCLIMHGLQRCVSFKIQWPYFQHCDSSVVGLITSEGLSLFMHFYQTYEQTVSLKYGWKSFSVEIRKGAFTLIL